jgi:alpha-galactosidase
VPGEITPAGKPFEVTVSATDEARVPVFDPRVTLTAPAGWRAEQVARPRTFVLGTGDLAAGRWRVTPPAVPLTADLHGAQYLRLVVTDGGDGNAYDRSDWAAVRLTCA